MYASIATKIGIEDLKIKDETGQERNIIEALSIEQIVQKVIKLLSNRNKERDKCARYC